MPDKRKDSEKSSKNGGKKHKIDDAEVEQISYEPVHFIRSHSKNNDPADIQTQVKIDTVCVSVRIGNY